jgi:NAD(P)H-hydrate epimerase
MTTHISAAQAAEIDAKLMGPEYGFTLEQLMELAGLSVAAATREVYPPKTHGRVLCVCGPGNNGGDGLVAARHLFHFGYDVSVCYPKRSGREPIYARLVTQLETLGVSFVDAAALTSPGAEDDEQKKTLATSYDVVLDGVFGFSFAGSPRAPFDALLDLLTPARSPPPIVAIDVPSGWSVDEGDTSPGKSGARPDTLVSLTAPKLGSKTFEGAHHFVGGRFLPPKLAAEYGLVLPEYEGANQCVRMPSER